MNKFDEMRQAVQEAKLTLRAADDVANSMAIVLVGRLRHVDPWIVADLKRELRDFNMQTRFWKGKA